MSGIIVLMDTTPTDLKKKKKLQDPSPLNFQKKNRYSGLTRFHVYGLDQVSSGFLIFLALCLSPSLTS
jgi:hypothetical protein